MSTYQTDPEDDETLTTDGSLRTRIKRLTKIKIEDIVGFSAGNPVAPSERDEAMLEASLEENGYVMPVCVRELPEHKYELIDGHSRIEKIRERFPDTTVIQVLVLDVETVADGRKIIMGLRNQATWDMSALDAWMREGLEEGIDVDTAMNLTGLTAAELDAFAVDDWEEIAGSVGDTGGGDDEDEKPRRSDRPAVTPAKRHSMHWEADEWADLCKVLGETPSPREVLRYVKLGKAAAKPINAQLAAKKPAKSKKRPTRRG